MRADQQPDTASGDSRLAGPLFACLLAWLLLAGLLLALELHTFRIYLQVELPDVLYLVSYRLLYCVFLSPPTVPQYVLRWRCCWTTCCR